jgi:transposase
MMNKDIKIIRTEFRRSSEARYIHRLHGVLLVLLGLSTVKAGKLLGDPQRTVAQWVIQFKKQGLDGLRGAEMAGRPAKLSLAQKEALFNALTKSPKDSGLDGDRWTNVLVSSLLAKRFGVTLTVRQCTRLLREFKDGTKT